MPTGKKAPPPSRPVIDPLNPIPGVRRIFRDWMEKKHLAKDFATQEKEANKAFQEIIESQIGSLAFTDDKGHQWIALEGEVDGYDSKNNPAKFNAIQRQRRVSLVVDEEAAHEILEPKKLLPEASKSYIQITDVDAALRALAKAGLLDGQHGVEVITNIDEDKLVALYFENKISQEEYNRIVTEKVSWALLPGRLA